MGEEKDNGGRDHLSSLLRGLQALELLNERQTMTSGQMAQQLGLPRTTAHRILETLRTAGYVEKIPYSPLYQVTPSTSIVPRTISDENWIIHVASPILLKVTQELRWSFSISTRIDEYMVVRLSTDRGSCNAITYFSPGVANSVLETVCGHVMLAYASPNERETIIDLISGSQDLKRSIARVDPGSHETVMEPMRPLLAERETRHEVKALVDGIAERTQAKGYALIIGRNSIEAALAVPVRINGRVRAALVMRYIKSAVPLSRVQDHFINVLDGISREISEAIEAAQAGHTDPDKVAAQPSLPAWTLGRPIAH